MKKVCAISDQEFVITDEDLKFYEKMGVPVPTLCPEERSRRRLTFRNDRHLYHRICDGTGKKIISMQSPDKSFPVYENEYWWGDDWDAKDYGRDFDFNRSFFDQFKEYYFLNEKLTKEAYEKKIKDLRLDKFESLKDMRVNFQRFLLKHPRKYGEIVRSEDCSGDWISDSKNCKECYELTQSEDCKWSYCTKSWYPPKIPGWRIIFVFGCKTKITS